MSESLSDRVRRLREQTDRAAHARQMDSRYSRTARAREDIRYSARFSYQVWQGLCWLYAWIIQPVFRRLLVIKDYLWHKYKLLWAYVVYKRTRDDVLIFSKTRAAAMIIGSFVVIWWVALPVIETVFIDLPAYALTAKVNENLYLWHPQEINSNTNSQLIRGCAEHTCSEDTALYFRVENGLFENLWSLWHGHGFFFPEYVASVPGSATACIATSYWFRFRLTSKFLNIYPYLLSTSCLEVPKAG